MDKVNDTTFKTAVKANPKDLIEKEVGDSKTPDKFFPQQKIMRWDNECNVSIRLKEHADELQETAIIVEEDGILKHKKSKRECHFYELPHSDLHPEGASEFEIILLEKPETNVMEFTLVDKGVEYIYQPELAQWEKDNGASRPDNVIGSYVIYATEPKKNFVGGKEYKIGKVGNIYRPKIIDSVGAEVWGTLLIKNGILSVTISQDFLDNAVYPVRHAAGLTFGYSSAPGTDAGADANCRGGINAADVYTAVTGDKITMFSVYGYSPAGATGYDLAAYTFAGGVPVTRLSAGVTALLPSGIGAKNWGNTATVSQAMSNGTVYCVALGNNGNGADNADCYYDITVASAATDTTTGALPASWTNLITVGVRFGMYATYTIAVAAGGARKDLSLLGVGT